MAFFKALGDASNLDILVGQMDNVRYMGLSALKNSDVLAGISILAGDIASSPVRLLQKNGSGEYDEELDYLLNIKPNNVMNAYDFKFSLIVNAITCGNGYAVIRRFREKPIQLDFIKPSNVVIEQDTKTHDVYYRISFYQNREEILPASDVLHLKFFTTDGIQGRSCLLSLEDEIAMQENGIQTLRNFFRKGLAGGILRMKSGRLSTEAKRKVREEFDKAQYSTEGASTTLILDQTMDFEPLQIDTNVLQLINSNNFSTAQIAKALMIPGYKLGVNSPNQSVSQLNADYVTNSLNYYFSFMSSEFNVKLMDYRAALTSEFVFNTDRILQSDREAFTKNVIDQKNAGIITTNKARSLLGYARFDSEEADKLLTSLNYTTLDQLAAYQLSKGGDKNEQT
ncbi:phage portal protein [Listeria sp. FSL L7-1582]|uniref:phage portal protein n=1 Tax=Listeria portnoyi TaxID=2713504 RepID=UPI00164D977C|nr:phage portal protein [Listeria portnoyi]MBC6310143.1 phage portal protein [Listeria portnoyi]